MISFDFYELNSIENDKLQFAVIMARYKDYWLFVKHKERTTWEIPGGHREHNEIISDTASRELNEETGADNYKIFPVCIYSVEKDGIKTFGQLFFAEIMHLGVLPDSEIGEVNHFKTIPKNLTYPLIQPYLYKKVESYLLNSN